jgi:polygalacturonase
MRFLALAALVPAVLGCTNPDTDACASAFTASSAAALTFCATYTAASSTATTGLPAYATYCSNTPKKVSSACSCLTGATAVSSFIKILIPTCLLI